jgi:hypothetical protein
MRQEEQFMQSLTKQASHVTSFKLLKVLILCDASTMDNVSLRALMAMWAFWACGLCFSFSLQTLICTSFLFFCSFQLVIFNSNLI